MVWTAVFVVTGGTFLAWLAQLYFAWRVVDRTGDSRSLRDAAELTRAFWQPHRRRGRRE